MPAAHTLNTWWRSHPLADRARANLAITGLIILCIGWLIRSAAVTFVGAAAWAPAASILFADWLSRGVGR